MQVKQICDRSWINPNEHKFLDVFESISPDKLSDGMWNKLYALLCNVRNVTHQNYWIYQGAKREYDVTTRTAYMTESYSSTIGGILNDKVHKQHRSSGKR